MGKTEDKAPKESFFSGISAEFKKIIWPEKKITGKTDDSGDRCFRGNGSCYRAFGFYHSVWR